MNGSTGEGDAINNIDDVGKKLKNVSLSDDCDDDDDVILKPEPSEFSECSNSEHENQHENDHGLSQSNYSDEPPNHMNHMHHLFHIDFMRSMQSLRAPDKRFKNGTRKSCTFTNEQVRQIERENRILLNKILAQRPRSCIREYASTPKDVSRACSASRVSSAAINRRRQNERINAENNILWKKIVKNFTKKHQIMKKQN